MTGTADACFAVPMSVSSEPLTTAAPEAATPVDDMSITVLAGRVPSAAPGVEQAIDAERLGFKRVWLPERYTNKDAGVLLGAMAARTGRIGVGTGPLSISARYFANPPIAVRQPVWGTVACGRSARA